MVLTAGAWLEATAAGLETDGTGQRAAAAPLVGRNRTMATVPPNIAREIRRKVHLCLVV
jgi:hypothetical protein